MRLIRSILAALVVVALVGVPVLALRPEAAAEPRAPLDTVGSQTAPEPRVADEHAELDEEADDDDGEGRRGPPWASEGDGPPWGPPPWAGQGEETDETDGEGRGGPPWASEGDGPPWGPPPWAGKGDDD